MRHEPGLKEDATNLSLVAGPALVTVLLTIGLLATRGAPAPTETVLHTVQPVIVEVVEVPEVIEVEVAPVVPEPVRAPLIGSNRIYGTVTLRSGSEYTGFIRWDRNEGSWVDLLDATKRRSHGSSSQSGIRFGHIASMDVIDSHSARFLLRSGESVVLNSNASDLGTGLRALVVDRGERGLAEFDWRDLETVDFFEPGSARPSESRMYGTLTTRSGQQFTGYVTWDVDEIYSTDVLDGEADGEDMSIEFGDIASIERHSSWGARVTLHNGESYLLEDSNDVDSSIRNISISDPALGQVLLQWRDFDIVEFHGTELENQIAHFDGGAPLYGTVTTADGDAYTGTIRWDKDEEFTWEMLNGHVQDVDFSVEFGNIARIDRTSMGSLITLKDGRSYELSSSNDVDHGNRGIEIEEDNGSSATVRWSEFESVVFGQ